MTAGRRPRSSSTRTASMVVPAGEHTASRSASGCSFVLSTISAAPLTVCAASFTATLLGSPMRTPPHAIASMNMYTYAAPLPDTPVTASIRCSLSHTYSPTDPKSASAAARSPLLSSGESHSAVMPQPTKAGVLGITRSTCALSGKSLCSCSSVHPAAIDTTNLPLSAPAYGATAFSRTCGLTASTIMSQSANSSSVLGASATPMSASRF